MIGPRCITLAMRLSGAQRMENGEPGTKNGEPANGIGRFPVLHSRSSILRSLHSDNPIVFRCATQDEEPHRGDHPMDLLRTPDDRFANLPGYAFPPHYVEVGGVRI